jgi:hypothetical protein
MSLCIIDEETRSCQSLVSDVISIGSADVDTPIHGKNGVSSDCARGVMAWAFSGKVARDLEDEIVKACDKRPLRSSEHLGPLTAKLERRRRTLVASSDCIPEGLLHLPATSRNSAAELLSPRSVKRRQQALEVSCFAFVAQGRDFVSQKFHKVATYIGQVVSCFAVRSDSGVGTGQVLFADSDPVEIAGELLMDGSRALSEMSHFLMNPKGRSRHRSRIAACKKRAKDVKTKVKAFKNDPVTQTLAYTLPAPQQRACLSPAVKGEPRIEPNRLERIVKAQSHKEAYDQMVRRSDALKANRHLQIPLGAAPFLLVVPACATCKATREGLMFLMCIHLIFALLLSLVAKLCGAKDT